MTANSEQFNLPEGANIPKFRRTATESNAGWILRNARANNDREIADNIIATIRAWLTTKEKRNDSAR